MAGGQAAAAAPNYTAAGAVPQIDPNDVDATIAAQQPQGFLQRLAMALHAGADQVDGGHRVQDALAEPLMRAQMRYRIRAAGQNAADIASLNADEDPNALTGSLAGAMLAHNPLATAPPPQPQAPTLASTVATAPPAAPVTMDPGTGALDGNADFAPTAGSQLAPGQTAPQSTPAPALATPLTPAAGAPAASAPIAGVGQAPGLTPGVQPNGMPTGAPMGGAAAVGSPEVNANAAGGNLKLYNAMLTQAAIQRRNGDIDGGNATFAKAQAFGNALGLASTADPSEAGYAMSDPQGEQGIVGQRLTPTIIEKGAARTMANGQLAYGAPETTIDAASGRPVTTQGPNVVAGGSLGGDMTTTPGGRLYSKRTGFDPASVAGAPGSTPAQAAAGAPNASTAATVAALHGPDAGKAFFKSFMALHEGKLNAADLNGKPSYWGFNAAANPDIDPSNFSLDQAADRFQSTYWAKSGAANLPPALAAVQADTYFRNPSVANTFLKASGGDPNKYLDMVDAWNQKLAGKSDANAKYLPAWQKRTADLRSLVAADQGQGQGPAYIGPPGGPPAPSAAAVAGAATSGNAPGVTPPGALAQPAAAQPPNVPQGFVPGGEPGLYVAPSAPLAGPGAPNGGLGMQADNPTRAAVLWGMKGQVGPDGKFSPTDGTNFTVANAQTAREGYAKDPTYEAAVKVADSASSLHSILAQATKENGVVDMTALDNLIQAQTKLSARQGNVSVMMEHLGVPVELQGSLAKLKGDGFLTPAIVRQMVHVLDAYADTATGYAQKTADSANGFARSMGFQGGDPKNPLGLMVPTRSQRTYIPWVDGATPTIDNEEDFRALPNGHQFISRSPRALAQHPNGVMMKKAGNGATVINIPGP